MAREHVGGRNWTYEEDVSLCLAWVSVSEDGALGTNQNKKVLWDKIIVKFQENCNGGGRDGGGVYDRWKTINKACTLWKGSLEGAMVGMPSGRSAIETGDKAMEIYKTRVTHKNQVFKLQHAWDVLKDCSRWATNVDQQWGKLFQREAAPRNEGVNEMTPSPSLARPPGRDKQNEAKRKGKSQDSTSGDFATGIAKMHETHSARQEEAARMRFTNEGNLG
ncbi:glutathione S-transferase T2-like [Malus domestica]|uniref:glutathione S-transferase T2-like n=1 Tax=Malus domestica TaxID=3750 RepID=UPI003976EDC1